MVCPGCNTQIMPIRTFERDKKSKKGWLITKCPRERCSYNIDIETHEPIKSNKDEDDKRRFLWKDLF